MSVEACGCNGGDALMDYLVDAGKIERMRCTSARDAALMMLTMWDGAAQWPIEVYSEATGEHMTFVEEVAA
jgi:hypothetical protein